MRTDGRTDKQTEEGGKAESVKCDVCRDVGDGAEKAFPATEQQEESLETELFECSVRVFAHARQPSGRQEICLP